MIEKGRTTVSLQMVEGSSASAAAKYSADLSSDVRLFAAARSVSRRPAHRMTHLKTRDFVDLCPSMRHPHVWVTAQINHLDKHSGQVQVLYEMDDKYYTYWAHLDNESEIDLFSRRSGGSSKRGGAETTKIETRDRSYSGKWDADERMDTRWRKKRSSTLDWGPYAASKRHAAKSKKTATDVKRKEKSSDRGAEEVKSDDEFSPFVAHLPKKIVGRLKKGDKVDFRCVSRCI